MVSIIVPYKTVMAEAAQERSKVSHEPLAHSQQKNTSETASSQSSIRYYSNLERM